ncbi:MAG: EpsI family protein [Armatimonadetes bacterium]|nr:EpsI family protein [Armatimonadota bacterium]
MVKRPPNYLLVLIILIVSNGISYWAYCRPPVVLSDAAFGLVPMNIGDWQGQDIMMDEQTRKDIGADQVFFRTYSRSNGDRPVEVLVVYRKYGRRGFVHRPELCYPGSGFQISDKRLTKIPYAGVETEAITLNARKDDYKEVVLYWFASGKRLESNYLRQQYLMAFDRLQTQKYGWAFIRINSPVTKSEDDTIKEIRAFLSVASEPLFKSLTEPPGQRR